MCEISLYTNSVYYYTLNSLTLVLLAKSVQRIFENQHQRRHNCRLYNNHVTDTEGHGLSCHVWPQSMISRGNHFKFALFVLLAVSEEAKNMTSIFFVQCIIKQLLDSVFEISKIIKVSVGLRLSCFLFHRAAIVFLPSLICKVQVSSFIILHCLQKRNNLI